MNHASAVARILEVTSYPPPRSGWAVRVEFLKKRLEREGHRCAVLNTGASRTIPSDEYETVLSGADFLKKVWRYSRDGYIVHAHANGDALKGVLLALIAALANLVCGHRCYLTFHAGAIQRYFPRARAWWLVPAYWLLFTIPRRIICNSDAVKERIQGYGVHGAKIVAIPAFSRQYLEFTPSELPEDLDAFFQRYPNVVFAYVRMRALFYPLTLIEGMSRVLRKRPDTGLVICGGLSHPDDGLWSEVQARIRQHQLEQRICFVEDLDHDAFLTALQRSRLYLRTPITDGVASSVLESLVLGVPVVACENGARPQGVITYPAEDAEAMAQMVDHVIANREQVVAAIGTVDVQDTLSHEVAVLTSQP